MILEMTKENLNNVTKSGVQLNYCVGFSSHYYTIWSIESSGIGDDAEVYCSYIQNLSKDKETAFKKALDYFPGSSTVLFNAALCGETAKFKTLCDFTGYLNRGKYKGEHISVVPKSYALFLRNNEVGGKLVKYFIDLYFGETLEDDVELEKYEKFKADNEIDLNSKHLYQESEKVNLTVSYYKKYCYAANSYNPRKEFDNIEVTLLKDEFGNIYKIENIKDKLWKADIITPINEYTFDDDFKDCKFTLSFDCKVLKNEIYKTVKQTKLGYLKNIKMIGERK